LIAAARLRRLTDVGFGSVTTFYIEVSGVSFVTQRPSWGRQGRCDHD